MIETTSIEKLSILAQFVLNRQTEDTRDELHEYLVKRAIHYGLTEERFKKANPNGLQRKEIIQSIFELFSFRLPEEVLTTTIERLEKKNEIKLAFAGNIPTELVYSLTDTENTTITRDARLYAEYRTHAESNIIQSLEDNYVDAQRNSQSIIDNFYKFLGYMFSNHGTVCANVLIQKEQDPKALFELIERSGFTRILSSVDQKPLRHVEIEAFRSFITSLDEKEKKFLVALAQSYLLAGILNVDPVCQVLARQEFERKQIFLDTNFIIAALCPAHIFHADSMKILKLMKILGAHPQYTKETLRELRCYLKEAKNFYEEDFKNYPKTVAQAIGEAVDSPFFQEFRKREYVFWKEYEKEVFMRLNEFLKTKYDLSLDDKDYSKYAIEREANFQKLVSLVTWRAMGLKTQSAAEHDTYHLLLLRKLRGEFEREIPLTGSDFWFLTLDKQLFLIDAGIIPRLPEDTVRANPEKLEDEISSRPVCVTASVWLNMLWPFLSPEVASKESDVLLSNLFKSFFPESSYKISIPKVKTITERLIRTHKKNPRKIALLGNYEYITTYVMSAVGRR